MTKGEGLVAFLYAIRDILEAGVIWVITSFAVLAFFWLIINYVASKAGKKVLPFSSGSKIEGKSIVYALFLLFIIFAIYSLIALTGAIFGVNSGPAGGLIIR